MIQDITRARRTIPHGYVEPIRRNDRVLVTCRNVFIGGAVPITKRPPITDHLLTLQEVSLTRDAERIQAALLDPTTERKANPSLAERIWDCTVRPFIAFC